MLWCQTWDFMHNATKPASVYGALPSPTSPIQLALALDIDLIISNYFKKQCLFFILDRSRQKQVSDSSQ